MITTEKMLLPMPTILSRRGPLPRTLVFSSVGDRGHAIRSWLGDKQRDYQTAIIYYGNDCDSRWARFLQSKADHFAAHAGGKFQNLLWWIDQNPKLLDDFDYVFVADDDLAITPDTVGRIVRTAREYNLPVASPSHSPLGRISWPHMASRGSGRRVAEPSAGVVLTNFVEMTCPLFEVDALRAFLNLFRRFAPQLFGWGADWIISSACYTQARPFGVLHNVSVVNPWARGPEGREIDRYQPSGDRRKAWRELMAQTRLPICSPRQIRCWLPKPRMRCINLERATERRERFTKDWIDGLGFPVRFFSAFDRRDVEAGRMHFPYDEDAAKRRTGRPLTAGEIACATSHALVMREEIEFCGPEGVFIFEDDCVPLSGADQIVERAQSAAGALHGVEVIACHKPRSHYTFGEHVSGAVRIIRPPWGSMVTWYCPQGLRRAYDILSRMEIPTDWLWRDLAAQGKFAMLVPPVAGHDGGTTYIGNEHRGVERQFIG